MRPRPAGAADLPPSYPNSALLLAFKKRTAGRCFICLAPDHRAASCRDPIRCFSCQRSAQKELTVRNTVRDARHVARVALLRLLLHLVVVLSARLRTPPDGHRSRLLGPPRRAILVPFRRHHHAPRPPGCRGWEIPAPGQTRISSSSNLEKEAQEWEGTTRVVMAMSAPTSTSVHEVEAVVLDEMRLHRGDVVVSRHQPQPFLLKFANCHFAEEAAAMRCLKHHGVVLNIHPWRSLETALGVALFFRVRLCLEGIPGLEPEDCRAPDRSFLCTGVHRHQPFAPRRH